MDGRIDVQRLVASLSEILSDIHGCKITITATPKEEYQQEKENVQ